LRFADTKGWIKPGKSSLAISMENFDGIGPSRGGEGTLNDYRFMLSGSAMLLNTLDP
jgi:hypothetical protein